MAAYEVPLSAKAQTFKIALGETIYTLTLIWRDADEGGWTLDIADAQGVAMVQGIPLVTGIDLLGQYAYLGFTGQLIVQTDPDADAVPTYANLGSAGRLYFVTG